jgi:hypothetical protein
MKQFNYKEWDLFDAIDALMAHDEGASDSGVSDEAMRDAVIEFLGSLEKADRRRVYAEFARCLLTDESIAQGYGLEDVRKFMDWVAGLGLAIR